MTTVLNNAEAPGGIDNGEVKTGQTPPDATPAPGTVVIPENWKESIDVEFRDVESMKLINSVSDLAKGYVHAQKAVGSDKIAIPSKHATPEDWKAVFNKIGLPETVDKYDLDAGEGSVDEAFLAEFKEKAFGANILPHQAQEMLTWYNEKAANVVAGAEKTSTTAIEEAVAGLKAEFGDAYVNKIEVAKNTLVEVGGEELSEKILNSGLGNDPSMIRFLVKAAELLKDDPIKGQAVHGLGTMTPADAQTEIGKLMADNAYQDKTHPGHVGAMAEMSKLFAVAHAE